MTDPVRIADLYDKKAPEYDARYLRRVDLAEDRVLYGWLAPHAAGRRVLDIGCGTSAALRYLSPADYLGVDISHKMLQRADMRCVKFVFDERAADRDARARVRQCDWSGLGYRDLRDWGMLGAFDLAFSLWAFPHLPLPQRALELTRECLAPGGLVVVQGFAARYRRRKNFVLNGHADELTRASTPAELERHCESCGFEVQDTVGFRHVVDPPVVSRLPVGVQAAGMRLAATLLPPSLAATHLVFARRPA